MSVDEAICERILINIKKIFGDKIYSKFIKNYVSKNSKKIVSSSFLSYILKNEFVNKYCTLHGLKDKNDRIFQEIVVKRHDQINIENLISFFRTNDIHLNEEIVKEADNLVSDILKNQEKIEKLKNNLINEETEYLRFLENLSNEINKLIKNKIIENTEHSLFNLNNLIILHKEINTLLLEEESIDKVFSSKISKIRSEYTFYFDNKNSISEFFTDKSNLFSNNNLFSSKKQIENVYMRPIIMFFKYIKYFDLFSRYCFISDERSFIFLDNSFKEIARMANEKQRKSEGDRFLERLSSKVDKFEEMDRSVLSELLFYHEEEFIFRRNSRVFSFLVFQNGFSFLVRNEKTSRFKYLFLEFVLYPRVSKCKLYADNDKFVLKLIWSTRNSREMTIIPFEEEEKAQRIFNHINEKIKSKTENKISNSDQNFKNIDRNDSKTNLATKNENSYKETIYNANIKKKDLENKTNFGSKNENNNKEMTYNANLKKKDLQNKTNNNNLLIHDEEKINNLVTNKVSELNHQRYNKQNKSFDNTEFLAAKIEFVDLLFLVKLTSFEKFYDFKKKIIARIGRHFYPEKHISEKNIDLNHYEEFVFYTRDGGNLYLLENDDDLQAAIIITNGKLDIVIESLKNDMNLKFL